MMIKKNYFLTGGTGFFGKSILYMLQRGKPELDQFTILSRKPEEFLLSIPPELQAVNKVEFQAGDVRNFVFPERDFEYVIHAAAPAREMPPGVERDIIVNGTRRVLEFARVCGARRMLFISSGAVYGPQPPELEKIPEDFPCHPITEYGIAKYEAEQMCLESGIPCVIARCFAFVGPYLDRNIHFAIGNFIRDCLAGKDIEIKGDGTPYRSYMYADDLVQWLFTLLEHGEPGRCYNVGSDQPVSILELAKTVRKALKTDNQIVVRQKPVPGVPAARYVPDISRCRRELQLDIVTGLEEAIVKSCVNG